MDTRFSVHWFPATDNEISDAAFALIGLERGPIGKTALRLQAIYNIKHLLLPTAANERHNMIKLSIIFPDQTIDDAAKYLISVCLHNGAVKHVDVSRNGDVTDVFL